MMTQVATAVVVLYPRATSNATPVACREGPTVQWTGLPGGGDTPPPRDAGHNDRVGPGLPRAAPQQTALDPEQRDSPSPQQPSQAGPRAPSSGHEGSLLVGCSLVPSGARVHGTQHTDLRYRFPLTTETTTPQINGFTQMLCLQTIMGMSPLRKPKPPGRK